MAGEPASTPAQACKNAATEWNSRPDLNYYCTNAYTSSWGSYLYFASSAENSCSFYFCGQGPAPADVTVCNQTGGNVESFVGCPEGYAASGTVCALQKVDPPEQYTLAILGNPLPDIVPGSSGTLVVRVTNASNEPKSDVKVRLKVDVEKNSGGHGHHDEQRPRGALSGAACDPPEIHCATAITDSDGLASFSFAAPEVSGKHTVTAACLSHTCTGSPPKIVNVKVPGLEPIPASPFYRPITPNADTNHPNTHFLKPEASAKLAAIAKAYYEATYLLNNGWIPNVMLNDASLEWGGVLDCFLTCGNSVAWSASHSEHRKGSVIDIRARVPEINNPTPDTLLYEAQFIDSARDLGIELGNPHGTGSARHFHVRLFGLSE